MQVPSYKDLLEAGVHFGHLKKKWNPKMAPYIFAERKGIHIIDLNKTRECLEEAGKVAKGLAKSGKKILFVATKKQARDIVSEAALAVGMPYVTDRWLGGMLTNFSTIHRSIKKMRRIDKMLQEGEALSMTKKERLKLSRERAKLEKVLGGIANMSRLPAAIFIVDIVHEHIALSEADKLGLMTIAMIDTNADPNKVDYPIPANDDATKSIRTITNFMVEAIREGLAEREKHKAEKEAETGAPAE